MGILSLPVQATKPMDMTPTPAISDLFQRHSEMVYRTALRVTGNPADAEDVLQTVFLRVLNQGTRLDPAIVPEGYFRRAATNASLDIIRRRMSHPEAQLDDTFPHAARQAPVLLKEQLRRAIGAIDETDAEMFLLRYVEGLSNGELGDLYGIDKKNVAVRLHRIRHALQAEMGR